MELLYFRNGRKMQVSLPLWQGAEDRGTPGSTSRRGRPVPGLPQRQGNAGFAAVVARGGGPEGRKERETGAAAKGRKSGAIWNDGTSSVIPPEGPPTGGSGRLSIRKRAPPGHLQQILPQPRPMSPSARTGKAKSVPAREPGNSPATQAY